MARLQHIKRRLDNWALWRARRDSHGLGFASSNMLAQWMASAGQSNVRGRESVIPVLHAEAEETERAVQALEQSKSELYTTLQFVYIKNLGVNEAARRMLRAVSTVHAQLDRLDVWLDAWLSAEREAKQAQRAALPSHAVVDAQARKVRQTNAQAKAEAVAGVISEAAKRSL